MRVNFLQDGITFDQFIFFLFFDIVTVTAIQEKKMHVGSSKMNVECLCILEIQSVFADKRIKSEYFNKKTMTGCG